jgi:adenosylcobinamide-GDP ribazoletransferase
MLEPIRLAFAFLTRIPMPPGPAQPAQLGAAVAWFPLVGVVIGLSQWLAYALLGGVLEAQLLAVGIVAIGAALTGALHLDGIADVFDGLGGGRGDRARALEIMRDPRIGAVGATALVLCLLAKTAAVASLCARHEPLPLYAAPIVARLAAVIVIVSFPYARAEGLGRSFRDHARPAHVALAVAITSTAVIWAGVDVVVSSLIALAVAGAVGFYVHRRIGLTGDGYGAVIEVAELVCLLGAVCS